MPDATPSLFLTLATQLNFEEFRSFLEVMNLNYYQSEMIAAARSGKVVRLPHNSDLRPSPSAGTERLMS